jgi:hypothetical protein
MFNTAKWLSYYQDPRAAHHPEVCELDHQASTAVATAPGDEHKHDAAEVGRIRERQTVCRRSGEIRQLRPTWGRKLDVSDQPTTEGRSPRDWEQIWEQNSVKLVALEGKACHLCSTL